MISQSECKCVHEKEGGSEIERKREKLEIFEKASEREIEKAKVCVRVCVCVCVCVCVSLKHQAARE